MSVGARLRQIGADHTLAGPAIKVYRVFERWAVMLLILNSRPLKQKAGTLAESTKSKNLGNTMGFLRPKCASSTVYNPVPNQ